MNQKRSAAHRMGRAGMLMQETARENAREMPRENARDPVSMGTASATAKSTERPTSLLSAVSVDRSSAVHQSKYDSKNRRVPRSQQHDSWVISGFLRAIRAR